MLVLAVVVLPPLTLVLALARGTGTQPPFTHTPRSVVIEENGSGPTHVDGPAGADDCDGADTGDESGGFNPGGSHPPFQHVPPPMTANGFGVVHVLRLGSGAGDAGVLGALVGTDGVEGPDRTLGADDGGASPGGSQPPFQHVPPPIPAKGFGVEQVLSVGGGVTGVSGTGAVGIEIGNEPGVVGEFGDPDGGVIPGGSHPPFQHVPPPIFANGSAVVQPDGGGGVLGVVGVLGGGSVDGGVDPGEVSSVKSGETLRAPFQLTDRTR